MVSVKKAEFLFSVADLENLPREAVPEIAVAGKSNVGKSSFINMLTMRKGLAKSSSEPGRTRLLNFFSVDGGAFNLVDLPGYGFAKAPKTEMKKWGELIEGYLKSRSQLKGVLVLLDARLDAGEHDLMLINFLHSARIPFFVLAAKCDKLPRSAYESTKTRLAAAVGVGRGDIVFTSAKDGTGRAEVLKKISLLLSD